MSALPSIDRTPNPLIHRIDGQTTLKMALVVKFIVPTFSLFLASETIQANPRNQCAKRNGRKPSGS